MMTEVTTGLASSQASEMRAGLQLWALAMGAMTSRMRQVRSLSTMGKSKSERRGVGWLLVLAGELAGEKAAGEGAPDEEAGFLGFEDEGRCRARGRGQRLE